MADVRVKICGLTRPEDAQRAAAAGAAHGGVILAPGGKRSVTPQHAAELFRGLSLSRVGIFVDAELDQIRRAADTAGLQVLQLHGAEAPGLVRSLRAEGRWRVWKAVRPRSGTELLEAVERFGSEVDGLLLDGWSAAAPGGTGARFPWEEVAEHRDRVPAAVELIAAGGLHPGNVARAIELLRPSVVDVSSGVESAPGIKDVDAIPAFVAAAARARPALNLD